MQPQLAHWVRSTQRSELSRPLAQHPYGRTQLHIRPALGIAGSSDSLCHLHAGFPKESMFHGTVVPTTIKVKVIHPPSANPESCPKGET